MVFSQKIAKNFEFANFDQSSATRPITNLKKTENKYFRFEAYKSNPFYCAVPLWIYKCSGFFEPILLYRPLA